MDRERDVEYYLKSRVEMKGGLALKFTSPGCDGVPDRIVIFPGGDVTFVELKTEGGRLSMIQRWQQERLIRRGCKVRTIWSKAQVDEWIGEEVMPDEVHAL